MELYLEIMNIKMKKLINEKLKMNLNDFRA